MWYCKMCMENFTCCMENFAKIDFCLLHSDFVLCMKKFYESFLQFSNFHACKRFTCIRYKLVKSVRQLTKTCKTSMQARLGWVCCFLKKIAAFMHAACKNCMQGALRYFRHLDTSISISTTNFRNFLDMKRRIQNRKAIPSINKLRIVWNSFWAQFTTPSMFVVFCNLIEKLIKILKSPNQLFVSKNSLTTEKFRWAKSWLSWFWFQNFFSQHRKNFVGVPFNVLQNLALPMKTGNKIKIIPKSGWELMRAFYEKKQSL